MIALVYSGVKKITDLYTLSSIGLCRIPYFGTIYSYLKAIDCKRRKKIPMPESPGFTPDLPPIPESEPTFETWVKVEIPAQYTEWMKTFQSEQVNWLQLLPETETREACMGMVGIDGNEYPVPSLREVQAYIMKDREKYELKWNQGFTEMNMVPFALPLERMVASMESVILYHYREMKKGNPHIKLLGTKVNDTDPDEPLNLDLNKPVFTWDKWVDPHLPEGERGADVTGQCVYYPTALTTENHGGKTKQEILNQHNDPQQEQTPFPGWKLEFVEQNKNIPRQGTAKTIGGRVQLEANHTPTEYLTTLNTDPQYQHEHPRTNESWITEFIHHLKTTNQVIDDWQGTGSANFLPGSWHPSSGSLGYAYWYRDDSRAGVGRFVPRNRDDNFGLRSAVG